jgi:Fe2+ or Zn2+ uptake regulation protein
MSHQEAKLNLEKYFKLLKKKGLKLTQTRGLLLAVIDTFTTPFTAEDLLQHIHKQQLQVHRATVYRDLHHFTQAGILNELTFEGSDAHYYELPTQPHHHHFVCQKCSKIIDVFPTKVERALEKFTAALSSEGLSVTHHHLKFYGRCSECSAATAIA